MKKHIKQLSLFTFVISAILLFKTIPPGIITWIEEHIVLVWTIYIVSWFVYNLTDRDE